MVGSASQTWTELCTAQPQLVLIVFHGSTVDGTINLVPGCSATRLSATRFSATGCSVKKTFSYKDHQLHKPSATQTFSYTRLSATLTYSYIDFQLQRLFFYKDFQLQRLSATKTFSYKDFQLQRLSASKTLSYKDFQLQSLFLFYFVFSSPPRKVYFPTFVRLCWPCNLTEV